MIDRVMTTTADDMLQLSALEFDLAYVIDKGQKAAGVLKATKADMVYGFVVDARTGAVLPATDSARELWEIGLSDRKKFYENTKPETRLAHEALDLGPWLRDEYHVRLTSAERVEAGRRRIEWAGSRPFVVGINTGCSGIIQAKKLTVEAQREIVRRLSKLGGFRVVLLGGKEDSLRNERIGAGLDVVQTPTDQGLRDGIISVAACDIVVSGDSLGLHLAIALQKWTVAWFGPTCAHEIDLYDRGVRVLTGASCSPCWKRNCDKSPMCYDLVSIDEIVTGVEAGARRILAERDSCPLPPTIALERD